MYGSFGEEVIIEKYLKNQVCSKEKISSFSTLSALILKSIFVSFQLLN